MGRYRNTRINGVLRREHDVVWEKANGRPIPPGHIIHHIDGNGHNNDISNLQLLTHKEHAQLHARLRANGNDVVDPTDPEVIKYRQSQRDFYSEHREDLRVKRKADYVANAEEARKRSKEYRETHREQVAETNRRYCETHKEQLTEYRKKYYRDNIEAFRVRSLAYRESHREELAEHAREYRLNNPDKVKEQRKRYQEAHREEIKERQRKYHSARKEERKAYVAANIDHIREVSRAWKEANKEHIEALRKERIDVINAQRRLRRAIAANKAPEIISKLRSDVDAAKLNLLKRRSS